MAHVHLVCEFSSYHKLNVRNGKAKTRKKKRREKMTSVVKYYM